MFDLRMLSTEEREEYDGIVYDATHDANGKAWPTAEFGPRFRDGMERAEAAGRQWPRWLMDDMVDAGLQRRAKEWLKQREFVSIADGESKVITKAAHMGVWRKSGGSAGFQQVLWSDMTIQDLLGLIGAASKRRESEAVNISMAKRLLKLCKSHGVHSVSDALKLEGVELDEFLRRSA